MVDNNNSPVQPFFVTLEQEWTVLNGMSYGVSQPTLYGVISSNIEHATCFPEFEAFIEKWLNVEQQSNNCLPSDNHVLIGKLLLWQSKIQQQHQVPAFEHSTMTRLSSESDTTSRYLVALPYVSSELTSELLNWLVFVTNYFLANYEAFKQCTYSEFISYLSEAEKHLSVLRDKCNQHQLKGMNTFHFIRAANQLSIPYTPVGLNVFRFGSGESSCLLDSSFTESTSVIGSNIAKSKSVTAQVLRNAGLPASQCYKVSNTDEVAHYCEKIGFPLVIKPDNLEQGLGVYAHLLSKKQAISAYKSSSKLSDRTLIEKHVRGDDYRITVFNGQVIKVVKRTAAGVMGDGVSTITQLIEQEQQSDFMQSILRQSKKMMLTLDEEAKSLLADQKLTSEDIPKANQYVTLRRKSNMSTGGKVTLIDLNLVHPDNIALAIRASQTVNLDIAGIDLLIGDISQSWIETDAIICEVNAQPQIGSSVTPHVYENILQRLMGNVTGIPIHLVIVSNDKAVEEFVKVDELKAKYQCNAVIHYSGIEVDNVKTTKPFVHGFAAIKAAIHDQNIVSALAVMSQNEVENLGLPLPYFESIDVYGRSAQSAMFIEKIKAHTNHVECISVED